MLVAWQQLRRFCNGPASVTPAAEPRTCAVSAARLKQISINRANAVNHQVKTLIHELAHALMRLTDPDGPELIYVKEEVVVESIAFNVVSGLGTTPPDTQSRTWPPGAATTPIWDRRGLR